MPNWSRYLHYCVILTLGAFGLWVMDDFWPLLLLLALLWLLAGDRLLTARKPQR